jgi:TatD DNase family protein
MIDTHCHLDLPAFDKDREAVVSRSQQAGVKQLVVPAIALSGFSKLTALATPTHHIALGLHPLFLDRHPSNAMEQLESWIKRTNPLAIGEIGLDFRGEPENHPAQIALFEAQLELAQKQPLPLLLHVVKSHDKTLSILRHHAPSYGGIVHGYNGSQQQAQQYLELGFVLGFGGVVTRERSKKIRHVAATLPDHALVLESDAPDLPPAQQLGERNEPSYLPQVVRTLAQLRGVSEAEIISLTSHNAQKVLGLSHET